jgi:hypothetical protein
MTGLVAARKSKGNQPYKIIDQLQALRPAAAVQPIIWRQGLPIAKFDYILIS